MDKFSFYELFSFIAPGFGFIICFNLYATYLFGFDFIDFSNNSIIEIFLLFSLALFIGVLLQIITFSILKWKSLNWYKKIVYKDPVDICSGSKHISKIMPFLVDYYEKTNQLNKHKKDRAVTEDDVFDFAYYYRECKLNSVSV